MDVKEELLKGNDSVIKAINDDENTKAEMNSLVKGQKPYALIITCSDSRVIPEKIFSKGLGELFVIRSAGNVINEGELGTIEYAIEHLHIKYILVLGHTLCGAVHASMHNEKGQYLGPILNRISSSIAGITNERAASIQNAEKEKEYIKKMFPDYDGIIDSGLYEIETNKVYIF